MSERGDRKRIALALLAAGFFAVVSLAWWLRSPPPAPTRVPAPMRVDEGPPPTRAAHPPPQKLAQPKKTEPPPDDDPLVFESLDELFAWRGEVRCRLHAPQLEGARVVVAGVPSEFPSGMEEIAALRSSLEDLQLEGEVRDGELVVRDAPATFNGELRVEGVLPTSISWLRWSAEPVDGTEDTVLQLVDSTRCTIGPLTAGQLVTGRVENEQGRPEPGIRVQGCWDVDVTDATGAFELVPIRPATRCRVSALRDDGALQARDALDVPLGDDGAEGIVLVLPSGPLGGIGITPERVDGGLEIGVVMPEGPAARAGLVPGDRIVGVDGASLEELGLLDAIALITGPPGTEVVLEVEDAAGWREVVLEREVIPTLPPSPE